MRADLQHGARHKPCAGKRCKGARRSNCRKAEIARYELIDRQTGRYELAHDHRGGQTWMTAESLNITRLLMNPHPYMGTGLCKRIQIFRL
jgi:hypothetical protein